MKPLRLTLQAFGPFADTQVIDFTALGQAPLFLIHGPTGAGKTSVLDGLCFAIYGSASGDRPAKLLRSDHADPALRTEAELVFSLGPKTYRVVRRLEHLRPKQVGTGLTTDEAEAELFSLRSGGEGSGDDAMGPRETGETGEASALLAVGIAEVNRACSALLGFKVEEFRQVVLLPQGQFQRLLQANAAERESLLEVLFKTMHYTRIEKSLGLLEKQAREKADGLMAQRRALLAHEKVENPAELAQREAEGVDRLASLQEQEKTASRVEQEMQTAWQNGRQLLKAFEKHDAALLRLSRWQASDARMALLRAECAKAQKAESLGEAYGTYRHALTAYAKAQTEGDQLQAALRRSEAAWQAAQARHQALAAECAERPQLEESLPALVQAVDWALPLPEWQARLTQLEQDAARCASQSEKYLQGVTDLKNRLTQAEQSAASEGEWAGALAQARQSAENLKQLAEMQAQALAHGQQLQSLRRKLSEAQAASRQAHAQGDQAQALFMSLQKARLAAQAAILAAGLRDGHPCPVCGATEHPHLATGHTEGLDDQNLNLAQAAAEAAEARRRKAETEERQAEAACREAEAKAQALAASLGEYALPDSDAAGTRQTDLNAARQAAEQHFQTVQEKLTTAQQAKTMAETLKARIQQGENLLRQVESEAIQVRHESETLTAKCNEVKLKWRSVLKSTWESARASASVPGWPSEPDAAWAKRQLQETQARIHKLKQLAEASALGIQESRSAWEKAQTLAQKAETDRAAAKAHFEAETQRFQKACEEQGFADIAAYESSRREPAAVSALAQELRQYDIEGESARAQEAECRAELSPPPRPDGEALEAAYAAAREAAQALRQALGAQQERIAQLRRTQAALLAIEAEYALAQNRHALAEQLHKTVAGTVEPRISFQRFVLGALLDDVLSLASARLMRMSRGRYLLERVVSAQGMRANARAGLDLVVSDSHTGTRRPAGMLSGGETFMASLALALGLADVVQAYAGGLRLESLFIDEGFGTLDPASLDQALQVLEGLREGGRLVGVISHVAELKERIKARVEVQPTPKGSKVGVIH